MGLPGEMLHKTGEIFAYQEVLQIAGVRKEKVMYFVS